MDYRRIIRGYYYATPVFFILERTTGIELRVSAFIDSSGWRFLYYLFCLSCMSVIMWKPGITRLVGLLESSINIVLLFVGAALSWMFPLTYTSTDDQEIIWRDGPIRAGAIVNFLLAGSLWIICFRKSVSLLHHSSQSSDPNH